MEPPCVPKAATGQPDPGEDREGPSFFQLSPGRDTARAMSQENVEIVHRALAHLNETGEPAWTLDDPDLVWTSRPDGPAHFTYLGLDGLPCGSASMCQVIVRDLVAHGRRA
jgi:hypothetical protein